MKGDWVQLVRLETRSFWENKGGKNFSKDLVIILVRYIREVNLECRMKTSYYFWLLEKEFQENDKGISQIAMVEKWIVVEMVFTILKLLNDDDK